MAKVLITGASGFIGFHLAETLRQRGDEVACLVRKTSSVTRLRQIGASQVVGDVTDRESLKAAVADVAVVYHLAGCTRAVHARQMRDVNTLGTENVAWACAQQSNPPVLVAVSSLAAAGPSTPDHPRVEADPVAPISQYGRSKRDGELAAQRYASRVPITVVRPPIVLGEGDRLGLSIFKAIARTRIHLVPKDRRCRFSVIHADDLVRGLILAAEKGQRLPPHGGGRSEGDGRGYYFLSDVEQPTYAELGRKVAESLGCRARVVRAGLFVVATVAGAGELIGRLRGQPVALNWDKYREICGGSWTCLPDKACRELGFRVGAPLSDRLRRTAEWYRKEGWL